MQNTRTYLLSAKRLGLGCVVLYTDIYVGNSCYYLMIALEQKKLLCEETKEATVKHVDYKYSS